VATGHDFRGWSGLNTDSAAPFGQAALSHSPVSPVQETAWMGRLSAQTDVWDRHPFGRALLLRLASSGLCFLRRTAAATVSSVLSVWVIVPPCHTPRCTDAVTLCVLAVPAFGLQRPPSAGRTSPAFLGDRKAIRVNALRQCRAPY
jgi:hypothetical protein